MKFWLGTHVPGWLWREDVPVHLFISARRLRVYKKLKPSLCPWALDSGGFSELSQYGTWLTSASQYEDEVQSWSSQLGAPEWVAPQDWMVEPFMIDKTGLSVAEHQARTVANFLELRGGVLGALVIPVLQGWTVDDYLTHVSDYRDAGIDLTTEPLVGVGSVCRRQHTSTAALIFRELHGAGIKCHGFGVKTTGLSEYARYLSSADSLAWSYGARMGEPLPECSHKSCANCPKYALRWRLRVLSRIEHGLNRPEQLTIF